MNFELSDEQEMLKGMAERFMSDRYGAGQRPGYRRESAGFSLRNWRLLGELGLIGAHFSPRSGGAGAGAVDTIVLFEALGRGMSVEPLIDCALLAGGLFERGASPVQAERWLPSLVSGAARFAYAHREAASRNNLHWVETRARHAGEHIVLRGEKIAVSAAVGADAFIVSALADNGQNTDAVELFCVPADAAQLTMTPYRQLDGGVAAKLTFSDVVLDRDARLQCGMAALEYAETQAGLARCAESLGLMETLFDSTLEYLRQRRQFGVPIGNFQALQHRMVAQYVNLEQSRSLLYGAASTDQVPVDCWRATLAGVRAFIAEKSVQLGQEAIQLHGGMGMSDELAVGHAHKRLLLLSRTPTDAGSALDVYAGVTA